MPETSLAQKNARRRVEMFKREYERGLVLLACHAALPVVLNTELLHLIRINFFLDASQPLSYLDESDLLLSPICQEIGTDLYEIESEVRTLLLQELVSEYTHERVRAVAGLLWQYLDQRSPWEDHIRLKRAQQLTALNFLNPEAARQWIAQAEERSDASQEGLKDWFVAMYQELQRTGFLEAKDTGAGKELIRPRSEPLTVSEVEFREVFGLDENQRPLEYIHNEFEERGEVIVDHATGLMWQQSGSDNWLLYEGAQKYVADLNRRKFAGYNDWRLPTIPELMSLLEPQEQSNGLYIKPIFDKKQWWCWSADRRQKKGEGSAQSAWHLSFTSGNVDWIILSLDYYVRCVRSGQ
ncbi:hypothetical protein U27_00628 [Candidatus Vecturithrix granuli]|uniref:Lcl C-terminal domain-containing protein n=1 Tax=Vecturithrix granuli TaxID=1499967 RepID=A0A081C825_VECG1|nr:hypothetical protein U27_00628 [Candidatus Vecturithrix granuli]